MGLVTNCIIKPPAEDGPEAACVILLLTVMTLLIGLHLSGVNIDSDDSQSLSVEALHHVVKLDTAASLGGRQLDTRHHPASLLETFSRIIQKTRHVHECESSRPLLVSIP